MGRPPVTLQIQHPLSELKRHYQNTTNAVERRRAHVIWLLASGKPRCDVIQLTAYSLPSVLDAIHRYNKTGLDGLKDRRETNPGAPTLLSDAELLLLAQTIRHDFEQGIVWRGADVQAWIETTLGQTVHYQRAYELLEAIGFSLQVPRPRHIKSSDAARADFKKTHSQMLLKRLENLLGTNR
jgi:transposase